MVLYKEVLTFFSKFVERLHDLLKEIKNITKLKGSDLDVHILKIDEFFYDVYFEWKNLCAE